MSYCQIVFEKGYFINNDGIKLECYIENVDWNNSPKSFKYKVHETDAVSKVENIYGAREFGIDNVSMFRRYSGNVEKSPTVTNNLTKDKNPEFKEETVFLQAVIIGDANLYVLTDDNVIKYFYDTKNKKTEQLIYIKYLSNDTNRTVDSFEESVKENNLFRQQLLNDLKCSTINENDFNRLEYKKTALSKLFKKYNQCTGSGKIINDFTEKRDSKSFSFGPTVGVYLAELSIGDPGNIYNVSNDFTNTIIKFGVDAEYILPFNKGSWSIFVSPTYQNFTVEKTYSKPNGLPGNASFLNYTAKIKYASIEVPFGLRRYFFINKSSKVFVNAGYVVDFELADQEIQIINLNNVANANITIPIDSRPNLTFGAGFCYKQFSAEARINFARKMDVLAYWENSYKSYGIMFGYKFF